MKTHTVHLGDVATIERVTASETECQTLPYVGLDDIRKDAGTFEDTFRLKPESLLASKFKFTSQHVLYGKLRPYLNKVALPDFDGVCTTEILPLLPRDGFLEKGFLYGLLLSPLFVNWASLRVSGANLPRLGPELLKEFTFELPDLNEQRRIAERFKVADQLRRTRRYALELSETFLPATFLQLFGDPGTNPKTFPLKQVETLFSDARDGVKCGPFGSALKKHEYVSKGVPVWTVECVGENEFNECGCLYITQDKYEALSSYSTENNDILVSRAGTVGRMAIVQTKHARSIIHSNLIRLSLDPAKCQPIYFATLMTHFASSVGRLKRGQEGAYTFMSTSSLPELQIPLPPLELQMRFVELVKRHERLRVKQREALHQAEHLFQTLLHQAFAGLGRGSVFGKVAVSQNLSDEVSLSPLRGRGGVTE